jgi:hypothetical protein
MGVSENDGGSSLASLVEDVDAGGEAGGNEYVDAREQGQIGTPKTPQQQHHRRESQRYDPGQVFEPVAADSRKYVHGIH